MMPTPKKALLTSVTTRDPKGQRAVAQFEAAFNKARLDPDAAQRFNSSKGLAADYAALLRKHSAKQPDYARAREILGDDFISPEDVRKVYQLQASENENMDALPSEDDLRWLKANSYILVPMPHEHLSVLDVRGLDNQLFYSKTGGWYEEQAFAKDERTGSYTSWLAIKKTVINGSLNKNWTEQNKLLSDVEHVPNAAEFCWAVTIYYKVRGIYLFPDTYARVSSLGSGGLRVRVGDFGAEGLGVNDDWDDIRYSFLGLSSARKF